MSGFAPPSCGYADDDAAYVLGALEPAEQQAFRAHLPGCERCREAVTELAVMPGLLARLLPGTEPMSAADAGLVPPPPLLPTLVRRVRAERRRAGWRSRLGGFLVAAAVGVTTVLVLPEPAAPDPDRVLVMAAQPGVPVEATLLVTGRGWGTSIDTRCRYDGSDGAGDDEDIAQGGPRYELWAIDGSGAEELVSSWQQLPGREITIPGSTGLGLDDIDRLEVRSGSGMTLLVSRP